MEENKDKAEGTLHPNVDVKNKNADAYGNLPRGLTSDELSQTVTQKLILNDLSKSEARVAELEPFRDKFQSVSIEKCVLEEKLKKSVKGEILYIFCISSGGLIIGLSKNFVDAKGNISIIMIIIGALLLLGGILFKATFNK